MRIAEEKQEVCCDCNTSCFDVPLCRQVGDYFKYISRPMSNFRLSKSYQGGQLTSILFIVNMLRPQRSPAVRGGRLVVCKLFELCIVVICS